MSEYYGHMSKLHDRRVTSTPSQNAKTGAANVYAPILDLCSIFFIRGHLHKILRKKSKDKIPVDVTRNDGSRFRYRVPPYVKKSSFHLEKTVTWGFLKNYSTSGANYCDAYLVAI